MEWRRRHQHRASGVACSTHRFHLICKSILYKTTMAWVVRIRCIVFFWQQNTTHRRQQQQQHQKHTFRPRCRMVLGLGPMSHIYIYNRELLLDYYVFDEYSFHWASHHNHQFGTLNPRGEEIVCGLLYLLTI